MSPQNPPIAGFTGWTLEDLARESGVSTIQAFRVLEVAVNRGEVARLYCGGVELYARLAEPIKVVPPPGFIEYPRQAPAQPHRKDTP